MPYVHINDKTNKVRLYGSIKKLADATKIKKGRLYETFSRKKMVEYKENENRIYKRKVI